MKNLLKSIKLFIEAMNTARAATALARAGQYDQVKKLYKN